MSDKATSDPRTDIGASHLLEELRRIATTQSPGGGRGPSSPAQLAEKARTLAALTSRVRSAFFLREADRIEREFTFLLKCLVSTRTMAEALEEYVAFIDCFWAGLSQTKIDVVRDRVYILPNNDAPDAHKLFLHELRARSIMLGTINWLCGGSLTDLRGHFTNPPIEPDKIAAVFPYPVCDVGGCNGISFRSEDLGKAVIRSPQEIPAFVQAAPMIALGGFGACLPYSQRVRELVTRVLRRHEGIVSAAEVCRQLGVSQATLHRRLTKESSHFREIRDGAINDVAKDLMLRTGAGTREIAELLGYSDEAAFRRSFQRWNGCSPAVYRNMEFS